MAFQESQASQLATLEKRLGTALPKHRCAMLQHRRPITKEKPKKPNVKLTQIFGSAVQYAAALLPAGKKKIASNRISKDIKMCKRKS